MVSIFIIDLFTFILASIVCYLIPGLILILKSKIHTDFLEKVTLASITGFVLFTLASYLLITLGMLQIIPLFIILTTLYFTIKYKKYFSKIILPNRSTNILIFIFVFGLGILGQLAIISPSGLSSNGDILFWSSNGHDGAWHIALMEEFKKGYPFQNPVLAGEKLVNYHFFSDIAPSVFSKFTGLSNLDLYFRFFPLMYSTLLGFSAFILGRRLSANFFGGLYASYFTYFAGSFGYVVTLLKEGKIAGESIFWATQIQSSIGNPPQIISDFIVLAFLFLVLLFLNRKDKVIYFVLVLLLGTLVEFKIYAAISLIAGMGFIGLIEILRERKLYFFSLFILSSLLSLILYLPNSSGAIGFLIFQPWWYIRTMLVEPSRLDWIDIELRRQHYLSIGSWKANLRIIQIELTGLLIFFLGNLGIRFIGIIEYLRQVKTLKSNYFYQLLVFITLFSFIFPLLFLQKAVASNTSQFLQYFILIFGILSGITFANLLGKINQTPFKLFIVVLLIIFSIPTQAGLLFEFYSRPAYARISKQEFEALSFISKFTDNKSIILTPPNNIYLDLGQNTPNIWDWADTAYVSAFSQRRVYFSDKEQVDIMGYKWKERAVIQKDIFEEKDPQILASKMKGKNINYIYFPKVIKPTADFTWDYFNKTYSNDDVEIWEVR